VPESTITVHRPRGWRVATKVGGCADPGSLRSGPTSA